ncbi:MAG: GNAT family N-acetyltransferase [Lachnospiraceae bacterium]|nr:GNAT family N-acetyltransferase [Lachnospiraceae bacterium]
MHSELISLFRRNFPFIVREDATVRRILGNKDCKVIEKRNEQNTLIGATVIHNNTILMLCVDKEYRNRGIGSELLSKAEQAIEESGYEEVTVGAGYDYLMPGVPTSKKYVDAVNERLYEGLDDSASAFFEKRGYIHSWDCNCFDMRFPLSEFTKDEYRVGDTIDGICYRFAREHDAQSVFACTDVAYEEFTQYYKNDELYRGMEHKIRRYWSRRTVTRW